MIPTLGYVLKAACRRGYTCGYKRLILHVLGQNSKAQKPGKRYESHVGISRFHAAETQLHANSAKI